MSKAEVRLAFLLPTIPEQVTLTLALYSRADAWIGSLQDKELDRPLVSLLRVIRLSGYGIYQVCRSWFPEGPVKVKEAQALTWILAAVILGAGSQVFGSSLFSKAIGSKDAVRYGQVRSVPDAGQAGKNNNDLGAASKEAAEVSAASPGSESQVLSLKDLGLTNIIEMRGPHSYYSVHFTLSHAIVPRHATLRVIYNIDPSLDPHTTSLRVNLNDNTIATLLPPAATEGKNGFVSMDVPVPDALLVRNNSITFEFTGSGVMQREDEARAQILCRISQASTLEVSGDRLRLQNDLSKLPLPIFDTDLQTVTTVPFVFLSKPSTRMLEAAGAVASWLGLTASSQPVRFSVSFGEIPSGNSILFSSDRASLPSSLLLSQGGGPLLALRDNPVDPYGSVLVLAGDSDVQLLSVARTLSQFKGASTTSKGQGFSFSGDTEQIPDLAMPPKRVKGDAPRWLPVGKVDPVASCQAREMLQTDGSSPIPVFFHVPPDLFYGEKENLKLHLNYRYDARPLAAGSALRIFVNGNLVNEAPLPPGGDFFDRQRLVLVPVADIRPFGNTIRFNFDFIPVNRDAAQNQGAAPLNGEILCNSTLDLQGLSLWTSMPNLELFSNAGFPFTQLADLSETIVVLPSDPSAAEIALYLHLMGHFGAQTGYPALRVAVAGPNTVISPARDYLILGTVGHQPAINSLDAIFPVTLDANGVHVKPAPRSATLVPSITTDPSSWWSKFFGSSESLSYPSNNGGVSDALVEEVKSPASPDRSIVVIALRQDSSADSFAGVLLDRSQSRDITGSASLLRNSKFESYSTDGHNYHVGSITWYAMMRIWLTQYFLPLLLVVTALSFLLARWTRGWLARHAAERLNVADESGVDEEAET
jgi:cellulose synthase (UDP-forming)